MWGNIFKIFFCQMYLIQEGMRDLPLKMCNIQGQKRCLRNYWYSFLVPLRKKEFQNIFGHFVVQNHYFKSKFVFWEHEYNKRCQNGWFWPPKRSKIFLKLFASYRQWKTVPVTFQAPQLVLIIAHLQRHPSLHLPISLIFNVFSKYFKLRLIF